MAVAILVRPIQTLPLLVSSLSLVKNLTGIIRDSRHGIDRCGQFEHVGCWRISAEVRPVAQPVYQHRLFDWLAGTMQLVHYLISDTLTGLVKVVRLHDRCNVWQDFWQQ